MKNASSNIKRVYPIEQKEIVQKYIEEKAEVSVPIFMIGIKDNVDGEIKTSAMKIKHHIAIQVALNLLAGKSSELYNRLYQENLLQTEPSMDYEFSKNYGFAVIQSQSKDPKKVLEMLENEIVRINSEGVIKEDFERIKKMIYSEYIKSYNSIDVIGHTIVADYFKGINSFDYIEEFSSLNVEDVQDVFENFLKKEKMVLSVIK